MVEANKLDAQYRPAPTGLGYSGELDNDPPGWERFLANMEALPERLVGFMREVARRMGQAKRLSLFNILDRGLSTLNLGWQRGLDLRDKHALRRVLSGAILGGASIAAGLITGVKLVAESGLSIAQYQEVGSVLKYIAQLLGIS